jgi:uncharacterized protein YebE (UPF0316 family)
MEFIDTPLFDYLVLPLLIFCMRICDVTLDTMRIILMTKGYKYLAPIIGFFEVLIWIVAISRIMQNLDNWICYVAYAAGFATGNYIGMLVDEKLAIGHQIIRVITRYKAVELADSLRSSGFGVTSVKATGMQGEVGILYIIVNRKNEKSAIDLIMIHNPNAFYTVENIHFVNRALDKNIIPGEGGSRLFPFARIKK